MSSTSYTPGPIELHIPGSGFAFCALCGAKRLASEMYPGRDFEGWPIPLCANCVPRCDRCYEPSMWGSPNGCCVQHEREDCIDTLRKDPTDEQAQEMMCRVGGQR